LDRNRLIVSADDFGISRKANRNILQLIALGKIDRVSVMVGGTIAPDELALLVQSGVKLDVHWDVGHSISGSEDRRIAPALVRIVLFLFRYVSGSQRAEAIERLWRDQMEQFRQLFGRDPDGINSHEHIHFFPPYFQVACALRKHYNISYLRFGTKGIFPRMRLQAQVIDWLRQADQRRSIEGPMLSSEYLTSLNWRPDLDDLMDCHPNGKVEVVCHPEVDEEFDYIRDRL
jgi:predicted glycoside hydrolase/deacetylase ChbG (UPF0249 family)